MTAHSEEQLTCARVDAAAIACLMSDGAEQPVRAADLHILNIGTGRITQYLEGEDDDHDWGIIQWGPKLPGLLFAAHDSFGACDTSIATLHRHLTNHFCCANTSRASIEQHDPRQPVPPAGSVPR